MHFPGLHGCSEKLRGNEKRTSIPTPSPTPMGTDNWQHNLKLVLLQQSENETFLIILDITDGCKQLPTPETLKPIITCEIGLTETCVSYRTVYTGSLVRTRLTLTMVYKYITVDARVASVGTVTGEWKYFSFDCLRVVTADTMFAGFTVTWGGITLAEMTCLT